MKMWRSRRRSPTSGASSEAATKGQSTAPIEPAETDSSAPVSSQSQATVSDDRLRLLHISDIHFGTSFDRSLWEYIVALIKRERPSVVACTGDMVDHGGLFMLALARKQLDALTSETGVPLEIRTVPGNHDCGPWGNLRLRPFSTNYAALFGPVAMRLSDSFPTYLKYMEWPWPLRFLYRPILSPWLYAMKWGTAVHRIVKARTSLKRLPISRKPDIKGLVLVYLDSNDTSRLATGNVDVKELTRLKATVLNMRDDDGERAFAPRIALVHHHPLPIPDSKITEGLTSFEPFLILRNAGIVLRELNRCDVDLILHGHKHYSSFSRLGYSLDHRVEGEIAVLAAGSAGVTHSEAGRNSVNFIDVFRNGRMTYTSIFFGGGAGEPVTELFRNTRYVHDLDMHKMRVHRRSQERQGQWTERVRHEVTIDPRGTARISHDVEGLNIERDMCCRALPIYIGVSMGRVPDVTLQLSEKSKSLGHMLLDPPAAPSPSIKCAIDLGHHLVAASQAAVYGYEYVAFNTYAITEWETIEAHERDVLAKKHRGRVPGAEFTGVVVRAPLRELIIRIQLPPYAAPAEPSVRVMRWHSYPRLPLDDARQFRADEEAGWVYDADMTRHEAGRLMKIAENSWQLEVSYPLVGHRYDIRWRVRDLAEVQSNSHLEVLRRGVTKAYRHALLNLDSLANHREKVSLWIQSLHQLLAPSFAPLSGGPSGFSVALFAFDEVARELRMIQESQADDSQPEKPLSVPLGEGVVGAALKVRRSQFYIDPAISGSRGDSGYLYDPRPEGEWGPPKWKFVVAFPIFGLPDPSHAFDSGAFEAGWPPETVVGVLTLSSTAPDSGLIRLTHPVLPVSRAMNEADCRASTSGQEAPDGATGSLGRGARQEWSDVPDPSDQSGTSFTATSTTPSPPQEEVVPSLAVIWALSHLLLARLRAAFSENSGAGTSSKGPSP